MDKVRIHKTPQEVAYKAIKDELFKDASKEDLDLIINQFGTNSVMIKKKINSMGFTPININGIDIDAGLLAYKIVIDARKRASRKENT